jgi:sulfur carrier protein
MKITVNNNPTEINENSNVENLIEALDYQQYQLAVAVNNHVVPKMQWQQTLLQENDNIVIIRAVSGG